MAWRYEVVEEDDELVASHAGDAVGFSDDRGEAIRGDAQDYVSAVVAEGIIDLLEVVEVEHKEREAFFETPGAFESDLQIVVHQGAGGKAGEGVMMSHVAIEFAAFTEFAGLLFDATSENNDPEEASQGNGECKQQSKSDASSCPPGGGLQNDQVLRRWQQDGELRGANDAEAFEGLLNVDLDGTDSGNTQHASGGDGSYCWIGLRAGQNDAEDRFIGEKKERDIVGGEVAPYEPAIDLYQTRIVFAAKSLLGSNGGGGDSDACGSAWNCVEDCVLKDGL